jgi:glutamyl-Q tRNA(Asp) synthetase
LHFGSLLAAVASYAEARTRDGQWLLRVDNIDPPREQPGATEAILKGLECYGFEWDGPVIYQSESQEAHEEALQSLMNAGQAYRCGCSRKDLADMPRGPLGTIYPGTCRSGSDAEEFAVRIRTTDEAICFRDGLQGEQCQQLESESGDFVIFRRDGLVAYQLAVVVDDHLQGVTEIVRGIDLMDSTPRQIWLQRLLGYRTPAYQHIPVVINAEGQKLSKLTGAPGIPFDEPGPILVAALTALGQNPPVDLAHHALNDIWGWALAHWSLAVLEGTSTIPYPETAMASG